MTGLKDDLLNRVKFEEQSAITLILGFLCRKKESIRKMKIFRRSDAKINADIDILNFIETQRRHKASLYGLMTKN